MMRDYFLGDATRMMLPREIALSDTARRRTTLARLTAGRVSVVMFWDRTCPWALEQLPQLPGLAARLRDRGVAFVPVVTDAPSPEEIAFLREHAMGAPVYFDVSAEARRAFGQWSTPEYYVLDERGLVRFKHSALDLVLTQAIVLLDASGD
jgi:hypothetical protein